MRNCKASKHDSLQFMNAMLASDRLLQNEHSLHIHPLIYTILLATIASCSDHCPFNKTSVTQSNDEAQNAYKVETMCKQHSSNKLK